MAKKKDVKISHQPKKACAPKKPAFAKNKFGAKWSFKGALSTKKDVADRAEYFAIQWYAKATKVGSKIVKRKRVRALYRIRIGSTGTNTYSIVRKKYYPYYKKKANQSKKKSAVKNRWRISSVYYTVWARNSSKLNKKTNKYVKKTSPSYTFLKPNTPYLGGISFNQFNRKWTCPCVAADSKPPRERVYTQYIMQHIYSWEHPPKGKKYRVWKNDTVAGDYNLPGEYVPSSLDSFNISNTLPATFDTIGYSGWALVRVRARSEGMGGYSATKEKYRVFSYPDQVAVKSVSVRQVDTDYVWNASRKKFVKNDSPVQNGNIIVNVGRVSSIVKSHGQNLHPIDSMTLQVLRNSQITDPMYAAMEDNWDDVDSGNGATTAFTDLYADSRPDAGRIVWYRVRTVHDHLERYSLPYRAKALEWSAGRAALIDATVVDDGTNPVAIKVIYGYNADHMDGTQIEWSNNKNAFNSNNPPTTATHDKSDATVHSKAKTTEICRKYNVRYNYTSEFYITGLEEGSDYYISARRYQGGESGSTYGPRAWFMRSGKVAAVTFARKPQDVSLTVPSVLTNVSEGAEVSWDFSAAVKQKQYTLYYVQAVKDSRGRVVYRENSTTQAVTQEKALKTQKTEKMFVKLTAKELQTAEQDGKVVLRVGVSCGGPEAKSSNATIVISSPPELTVSLDTTSEGAKFVKSENTVTLTGQGGVILYEVNQSNTNVFVSVIASGKAVDTPSGSVQQLPGDVLYTGVLNNVPANGKNAFTLPECEFFDVAGYSVEMTPVSRTTGLRGTTRTLTFSVEWAHQAKPPSQSSYILGDHDMQTATIYPFQPEAEDYATGDSFSESDVCDVYRVTPDGAYLIASGIQFGKSVTDPFAPFSNHTPLRYRLVTRTVDGDYDWTDVSYSVRGYSIRFDWFTGTDHQRSLSLPYNLRYSDKWHKQFESVRSLDGGKTGWWLPGVDRTSSLSTDMVRLDAFEDQELVRELANYAGAVFVRTPNGCAYTANVDVSEFPMDYDKLTCNVKFEAEEIDLDPRFTVQAETLSEGE